MGFAIQQKSLFLCMWVSLTIATLVYVIMCSDAKNMARAVNQTLIDMAIQLGRMDSEKATNWVKRLRAAGRYQEDVWS